MEKNLMRWCEMGLISKEKYLELLCDYKNQKEKTRKVVLNTTIYVISAILLGIGIILFIGANDWILEFLNKHHIVKITLLFFLTLACLFGGYNLAYNKSNYPKLGHSLIFLSTILIGGVYALLGQIYNAPADTFWLYLVWFISIYPLAFIFKNMAINILSCIIFIIGFIFYYDNLPCDTGFIYIPLILGGLFYAVGNISKIQKDYNNFSISYKNISISAIFITLLILTFIDDYSYNSTSLALLIPLILTACLTVCNWVLSKEKPELLFCETCYFCSLLAYIFVLMLLKDVPFSIVALFANVYIIAMIGLLYYWGYKFENYKFVDSSTKILVIYVVVNYIRFASEYLQGASLFVVGGLLLLFLGLYLENKKKSLFKGKK